MTYTALLLSPDDEVIATMCVPKPVPSIDVAKTNPKWFMAEFYTSPDVMPELTLTRVRFVMRPLESEFYSLLADDNNVLVYRQEGTFTS
jgi:hypothetical protein